MANQFQRRNESASAHLPRSGHSLSHKLAFTAACGQLLPTFWDYALPGDKYSIKTEFDLSRALPLLQPASIDIEVVTDYFFIPMDLMRGDFGERYHGTNQVFSSSIFNSTSKDSSDLPRMNLVTEEAKRNVFHNIDYCDSIGKQMFRLFDMLGFNTSVFTPPTREIFDFGNTSTVYWNSPRRPESQKFYLWPFLAYQAIYQYYYRDEETEVFDNEAFNIDNVNDNYSFVLTGDEDSFLAHDRCYSRFFRLRYVNRRADYFTDTFRSALLTYTNVSREPSALGADKFGLHNWLSENTSSPLSVDNKGRYYATNYGTSVGSDFESLNPNVNDVPPSSLSGVLNTAGLRAMFAQEKLLRITAAAKKNYDDQTLAHFGIKVPHDVKHQITHFGRNVMKYKVAEVVSTAQTTEAPLGEQAGRLYGQSKIDGVSQFTAPVHGVVMAITFVRPDYMYIVPQIRMADYWHLGDFWRPEYDHIGPQPVFRKEVQFNAYEIVGTGPLGQYANDVVRWQYRYKENKSRFNRATKAFANGTYQSYLITTSPWNHIVNGHIVDNHMANYNWIDNGSPLSFKVSPTDTDGIFGAPYNPLWQADIRWLEEKLGHDNPSQEALVDLIGQNNVDKFNLNVTDTNFWQKMEDIFGRLDYVYQPEQVYATDPFQLNASIFCNKVSVMSENSLPKMDM